METIFNGNIIILYMITGLSIFNLTAMNRDQQVALIYCMSFLLVLLQVLNGRIVMLLLITVLYLALEWFTEDKKKLQIITAPTSKGIINYIEEVLYRLDSLIVINETAVQRLKEYRQSLIYEAVTGKFEV